MRPGMKTTPAWTQRGASSPTADSAIAPTPRGPKTRSGPHIRTGGVRPRLPAAARRRTHPDADVEIYGSVRAVRAVRLRQPRQLPAPPRTSLGVTGRQPCRRSGCRPRRFLAQATDVGPGQVGSLAGSSAAHRLDQAGGSWRWHGAAPWNPPQHRTYPRGSARKSAVRPLPPHDACHRADDDQPRRAGTAPKHDARQRAVSFRWRPLRSARTGRQHFGPPGRRSCVDGHPGEVWASSP